MGTRCSIRLLKKDGSLSGISCSYDGYLSCAGVKLQIAYNTAEKVKQLISLGDLSSLGLYLTPPNGEPHSFENPCPSVCVAYHRDRGEDFKQSLTDENYIYTFSEAEGVWYYSECSSYTTLRICSLLKLPVQKKGTETLLLVALSDSIHCLLSGGVTGLSDYIGCKMKPFVCADVLEACINRAQEAREQVLNNQSRNFERREKCELLLSSVSHFIDYSLD